MKDKQATQFRRPPRRLVDGVLLLDKPLGLSSNTALQMARRLLNAAKAGHTGTLDPLATGLLPLCFGEATKFSSELLDADKTYEATLRLGITTDTADAEGRVLSEMPVAVSQAQLEAVLQNFLGAIEQVPPMYSALKRDGKPLYEYARAGVELERAARQVTIYDIVLLEFTGETARISVTCSKGTYIRTLAEDIGKQLGCGAHLAALRRTRIGRLGLDGAVELKDFEASDEAGRDAALLPADALLANALRAELNATDTVRLTQGQPLRWQGESGTRFRMYADDGRFLGLCELGQDGWLRPKRLVTTCAS